MKDKTAERIIYLSLVVGFFVIFMVGSYIRDVL